MLFRGYLRDSMVDSVMTGIEGKNCKDDLDNYLFSLDSLQSSGSNFSIKSRLEQDVPEEIRDLMHTSVTPSIPDGLAVGDERLTLMERNIVSYIGGYVLTKLVKKNIPCRECTTRLTADQVTGEVNTLIQSKQYLIPGLRTPSAFFVQHLIAMEVAFRQRAAADMHVTGIRASFITNLMRGQESLECQQSQQCKVFFCVAALYTNIRLHHHCRDLNQQVKEAAKEKRRAAKRKAATFRHL